MLFRSSTISDPMANKRQKITVSGTLDDDSAMQDDAEGSLECTGVTRLGVLEVGETASNTQIESRRACDVK